MVLLAIYQRAMLNMFESTHGGLGDVSLVVFICFLLLFGS